jgi:hypothetical protein
MGDQNNESQNTEFTQTDFSNWMNQQPEEVQALYSGHIEKLKADLAETRQARKGLEGQLKEFENDPSKAVLRSPEAQEATKKVNEAQAKAAFYQAAHDAGVTSLAVAYQAAKDAGLLEEDGGSDFDRLKDLHPELFSARIKYHPPGNAGSGTGGTVPHKEDFSNAIRKAAGRMPYLDI